MDKTHTTGDWIEGSLRRFRLGELVKVKLSGEKLMVVDYTLHHPTLFQHDCMQTLHWYLCRRSSDTNILVWFNDIELEAWVEA